MDSSPRAGAASDEIRIFPLLVALWSCRVSIIVVMAACATLGMLAVRFLVQDRYVAETVFVPPSLEDKAMTFMGIPLGLERGAQGGLTQLLRRKSFLILEIVQSRDIRRKLVERLNLTSVFKVEGIEKAESRLKKLTRVEQKDTGAIHLRVEAHDPQLAKALADAYLEAIRRRARSFVQQKIEHIIAYLQARTSATEDRLNQALRALQTHQEQSQVLDVGSSAKALTQIIVELAARRVSAEVELRVLAAAFSDEAWEIVEKKRYIQELDRKLDELRGIQKDLQETTASTTNSPGKKTANIFPQISALPKLAVTEQRHRLNIEAQAKITATLKSHFELARLALIRQEQHMQILDPPITPRSPTARKLVAYIIALLLAFSAGLVQAAFRLGWKSFRENLQQEQTFS